MNTCDINYRTARNKRLTVELTLVKLCQIGAPVQTVNAAPQPQAAAPQKKEPVPTPSPAPTPSPTPAPAPTPSIPKMPKIGLGIGKKPEAQPTTEAPAPETAVKEEQNRPFTADQLRDAWVGLAATHKEEPRLKQLIEDYSPQMIDELTAEIQMPNPWQMTEMRKALPNLMRQLRAAIHNEGLQIQLVQAEYNQEQMAFTAEEKYKLMAEQNPVLSQLKERLDLVID